MESLMLATCIPSGSLLSAAFDPEVISEVIDGFADELVHYDVDVILGPGINIHRSPLCGRNFEYYSEDPRLTGAIAAKFCERFTKKGVFATLKHFAVNSQETERVSEDEVLSERALREIYLKGFEIAVREGNVRCIMTSYNRINGRSASSQYDLCTTILRGEWGYDGIVMTDWWPKVDSHDKTSFRHTNVAEIIKAQNDVYMVVDDAVTHKDNMPAAYESGLLTLGELQRSVKNLLSFIMQTLGFKTKRASVLDSLSSVGDPVLSIGEEGLEKRLSGASDYASYDGGPHCTAELSLEEEGYYCLELFYAIPADITAQNKMRVALNDRDVALLILPGTNGEIKAQKTRMYLAKDNCIVFEKDYVKRINVYKIEEK
jgi:beta-glucosidase